MPPSTPVNLTPDFIQTIRNTFGKDGEAWLSALPDLIAEACYRWSLTDIQPVSSLSYNFVAFAQMDTESNVSRRWFQSQAPFGDDKTLQSTSVILKLGVPNRELSSEIAALRFYDGQGACRLLDADAEKGILLLERLKPGHMLATVMDDERATRIAAEVMKNLWRSSNDLSRYRATAPRSGREPAWAGRFALGGGSGKVATTDFIQLKDWFDGFKCLCQCYNGKTGPLPQRLVETSESLSRELLAENKDETLLHGDFHHYNVLESARGWLAIDPKGVVGPRGYEVGPFLINPVDHSFNGSNPQACLERSRRAQTEKRIAILSEMLDVERERIRSWGICHAVLSAWWSIENNDPGRGEYSLRCAEIFIGG